MKIPYTQCPVRSPALILGGGFVIPRPLLAIRITGPSGSSVRDGLLDTGADETILDPTIATQIGVDLTQARERVIGLVGRGLVRCRYASVQLLITDGVGETYEWDTTVGFTPFPVLRCLLGFAGFLQFFDASFLGADEEVELTTNRKFTGRRI